MERFKALRSKVKQLINESRAHFFETRDVDLRNNLERFWSVFKFKSKSTNVPLIISMRSESDTVYFTSCPADISELFNNYFISFLANVTDFTTPLLTTTNENILSELVLSSDDVVDALLNLCTSKATGPDGISRRLLGETAHQIAPSLYQLFHTSFSSSSLAD